MSTDFATGVLRMDPYVVRYSISGGTTEPYVKWVVKWFTGTTG